MCLAYSATKGQGGNIVCTVSLCVAAREGDTFHCFKNGWALCVDEIVLTTIEPTQHADDRWNFCFSKATCDYIFWLHPADTIDAENQKRLATLLSTLDGTADIVMMSGQPRLVKRENHYLWFDPAVPILYTWGKKQFADIAIVTPQKKMADFERIACVYADTLKNGASLTPRAAYYYAQALEKTSRETAAANGL